MAPDSAVEESEKKGPEWVPPAPKNILLLPDKKLRVPILVARCAGLLCLLRRDSPDMGFMALVAFHIHFLNVEPVFADIDNILVTRQAVSPVGPRGLMGFVTLIAEELHRGVVRHIDLDRPFNRILIRHVVGHIEGSARYQFLSHLLAPVTEEAFLAAGFEVLCPVGMTVKARKTSHSHTVHLPPLVTPGTKSRFSRKLVGFIPVTLHAFDLFHEVMSRMEPRMVDELGLRVVLVSFPVAAVTGFPGNNDIAVPRRNRFLSQEYEFVHLLHLVLFRGMVALMAVDRLMFADMPLLVRLVMDMTDHTGIGIILEIIVDFVRNES